MPVVRLRTCCRRTCCRRRSTNRVRKSHPTGGGSPISRMSRVGLKCTYDPFLTSTPGAGRFLLKAGRARCGARNGRELFYLVAPTAEGLVDALNAVPIQSGPSFAAGPSRTVFKGSYLATSDSRMYDVSPDGQQFLMIKEASSTNQTAAPPSLVIVQNWQEELKRLVPTR